MFAGRGLAPDGLTTAGIRDTDGNSGNSRHLPRWQAEMGYDDFSTFTVILQPGPGSIPPSTLIFKRDKLLLWKLSGIEMAAL
jgi:hypothetical protein